MKFPSLFKKKETKTSGTWPPSKQPKALSLQAKEHTFKKINSVLSKATKFITKQRSWHSGCSEDYCGEESLEMAFHALRSERLFFEPDETSSILSPSPAEFPFHEFAMVAMKSENPYWDFRISMEEVVEACGLKCYGPMDREGLEELLAWYLRMNAKSNHNFIVWAFVDMFLGLPPLPPLPCCFSSQVSVSSSKLGGRQGGG